MIAAFRLQRQLGRESTLGVLATTRAFGPELNQVVALDSRLRLNPNWFLTGPLALSRDRARDGKEIDGTASYAELLHSGRHFTYVGSYAGRSPGFRAPVGFIRRVDVRQTDHYTGYFWPSEASRLLSVGPSVAGGATWDWQGRRQDWYAAGNFAMDFAGPIGFTLSRYDAYELYLGTGFRHSTTGASFYTGLLRWLSISGSYSRGTGINYSPPAALVPFLGNADNSSATMTLRPTSRLRLDETYFFSRPSSRSFRNQSS